MVIISIIIIWRDMENPYKNQTEKAFWRPAVAERNAMDYQELWIPLPLKKEDLIATAGSCFSQNIGRNLVSRGANFMDLEPAPPLFDTEIEARRFGFGVFSCRYGNIYTTRQLIQLFDESFGNREPKEIIWERENRFFDALRPGIDPIGQETAEKVISLRKKHLLAVRKMFCELDLFIFTFGLTEAWECVEDSTVYPTAPGTIAGSFDPEKYQFRNFRYNDIIFDFNAFFERLRAVNNSAKVLLTVSPVPMTATATSDHILPASVYSKSVLRAAAGDLACDNDDIFYFPGYEIVSTHGSRGMFFNQNMRTINQFGIDYVMTHFFSGELVNEFHLDSRPSKSNEFNLICDEEKMDPLFDDN